MGALKGIQYDEFGKQKPTSEKTENDDWAEWTHLNKKSNGPKHSRFNIMTGTLVTTLIVFGITMIYADKKGITLFPSDTTITVSTVKTNPPN